MAEIFNLRNARKQKARAEKEAVAAENRVRFGRLAHERKLAATLEDERARILDLHRRADGESEP